MTNFQIMIRDLVEADFLAKEIFKDVKFLTLDESGAIELIIQHLLKRKSNGGEFNLIITSIKVLYNTGTNKVGWIKEGSDYKSIFE